jgi:threonine dehydrogenase-like Zn-dependent dehydrogenase
MSSARALWFTAPRVAELIEEPIPHPGPGEILVDGIVSLVSSGTELVMYRGEAASAAESDLPTAAGTFPFPLKYAYQIVGRVSEAGAGSGMEVGQTVFVYHPHQERFVVPTRTADAIPNLAGWPLVYTVPGELSPEKAVFANLFCVALNCLLDVPVRIGDCVVVSGLGIVGTFCAYLARLTAKHLILVDPLPGRRERAAWIGADAVTSPGDAMSTVADLTNGVGADVYIEASGAPPALQQAVAATGTEGTIAVVSYYGRKPVPLVLAPEFHLRRQRVVSSMVGAIGSGLQPRWTLERRMDVAMTHLAGIDTGRLVTQRFSFDDAVAAYELIDHRPDETLGVLLEYAGHHVGTGGS